MTTSIQVQKGDTCYHKVYGYGEVLDVYKDDNNRLIVQARFAIGFQYINYDNFMRSATVYTAGMEYPVCPACGQHPAVENGPCFACQKQQEAAPKKKKVEQKSGYFDDEEMDNDGAKLEEYALEMGYREDLVEGGGSADEEDVEGAGFSFNEPL